MPFPRSFRTQAWFVRLSLGEIELVDGAAVERGFSLGTFSAHTPVCAVGTQAWVTLGTAAAFDDRLSLANLAPEENPLLGAPVPDTAWRSRRAELPACRSRRSPIILALSVAMGTALLLGVHLSSALVKQTPAAPRNAVAAMPLPVVVDEEPPPPAPKPVERLNKAQVKQLRVVDQLQKQYKKDHSSRKSRTSLAPPR